MKRFKDIVSVLLAALLMCALIMPVMADDGQKHTTTVLFTHDLHSHFLPVPAQGGGETGGYARLATALNAQRAAHPGALTLDGGDFSIGSLIQTLYTTQAAELRTMGAMGYDASTIGNHEFDHTGVGFAQMLSAAAASGDKLPALVEANYAPAADNPDREFILRAMEEYGVSDGIILERDGIKYGIFGLMGTDSDDCAPTSGFVLENATQATERCVAALKEKGAQFIICLSHSGTSENVKQSEDEQLAKAVSGIDLIISGHTHTTLDQPIVVNNTYIVSAGPYCRNLGSITLEWDGQGNKTLKEYQLIPIDETLADDQTIARMVEGWKDQVGQTYLAGYGLTYDQVMAHTEFDLLTPDSGVQTGNALGELIADAFRYSVQQAEGSNYEPIAMTVTADGVIRADLAAGDITVSQAFDVLSMGVGSDGTSGFPLVSVYLTGKELKAAMEVDASVTPIMPAAQLYMSGVEYDFNTCRMFFNRVTDSRLVGEDGSVSQLEDDKLYRVVTGMYSAQMLGTVKGKSMGLLSLEPKMADGSPVTDFDECIIRDQNGNEIKEWYALASYLASFDKTDGVSQVPARYSAPDGRKGVISSWNPIQLLKHPNWITLAVLAVIVLVVLGAALLVRVVVRRRKNMRRGRRG